MTFLHTFAIVTLNIDFSNVRTIKMRNFVLRRVTIKNLVGLPDVAIARFVNAFPPVNLNLSRVCDSVISVTLLINNQIPNLCYDFEDKGNFGFIMIPFGLFVTIWLNSSAVTIFMTTQAGFFLRIKMKKKSSSGVLICELKHL